MFVKVRFTRQKFRLKFDGLGRKTDASLILMVDAHGRQAQSDLSGRTWVNRFIYIGSPYSFTYFQNSG